jgi:hypothetical protein
VKAHDQIAWRLEGTTAADAASNEAAQRAEVARNKAFWDAELARRGEEVLEDARLEGLALEHGGQFTRGAYEAWGAGGNVPFAELAADGQEQVGAPDLQRRREAKERAVRRRGLELALAAWDLDNSGSLDADDHELLAIGQALLGPETWTSAENARAWAQLQGRAPPTGEWGDEEGPAVPVGASVPLAAGVELFLSRLQGSLPPPPNPQPPHALSSFDLPVARVIPGGPRYPVCSLPPHCA